MKAKIIWFTGLSGTGKTTLSKKFFKNLRTSGFKVKNIDGDTFRKKNKNKNKFTKENILKNNYSIIRKIKKIKNNYDYILVSVISPLLKSRKISRKFFKENYFEVYMTCKLKTLENRDTKSLYKKAKQKLIKNLIGYNSKIKYQKSDYPVIRIDTDKNNIRNSLGILKKNIL